MKKIDQYLVERVGQKIWVKEGDIIWSYDLADIVEEGTQRRKKANVSSPDTIIAPMPGKITKVFVQKGDVVKQGQPLLVMEAMKMEYTLKSELDSEVEKIDLVVNQQVGVGDLLVKLKSQN